MRHFSECAAKGDWAGLSALYDEGNVIFNAPFGVQTKGFKGVEAFFSKLARIEFSKVSCGPGFVASTMKVVGGREYLSLMVLDGKKIVAHQLTEKPSYS